jgi:hypothetical protein
MKIAYCISGHAREFEKHLSEPTKYIKNIGGDIFVSTWDRSGLNKCFWRGQEEDNNIVDKETIVRTYRPKVIDIENRNDYNYLNHYNKPLEGSPYNVNALNTILMFKKIKKCIEHTDDSYDVVIRSRFDLYSLEIDLSHNIEPNTIYGTLNPVFRMPSDILFYGTKKSMIDAIPDEYFYTPEITSTSINAEDIFLKYLQHKNINFKPSNGLRYSISNSITTIYQHYT